MYKVQNWLLTSMVQLRWYQLWYFASRMMGCQSQITTICNYHWPAKVLVTASIEPNAAFQFTPITVLCFLILWWRDFPFMIVLLWLLTLLVEAIPITLLCGYSYHGGGSSHNCPMWLNSHTGPVPMTVLCGFSYHDGAVPMTVLCGSHIMVRQFLWLSCVASRMMVEWIPMTVVYAFS